MSNDFISLFYRQNLISSAFEIQISVCKRGTSAIVLKAQHTMAISLLKFVGLFAGSAISITKIRLRYVVLRPSCTFTLQSLRKWSFQLVRYIIARYILCKQHTYRLYVQVFDSSQEQEIYVSHPWQWQANISQVYLKAQSRQ